MAHKAQRMKSRTKKRERVSDHPERLLIRKKVCFQYSSFEMSSFSIHPCIAICNETKSLLFTDIGYTVCSLHN